MTSIMKGHVKIDNEKKKDDLHLATMSVIPDSESNADTGCTDVPIGSK